jgi:hypothetical protein
MAYFSVRLNGEEVEWTPMGTFSNGSDLLWSLELYDDYGIAYVGTRSHQTNVKIQDLGLSLHGSGSATYWNYVEVTLWQEH